VKRAPNCHCRGLFVEALVLIGIGIVVGSAMLMLFVTVADIEDVSLGFIVRELLMTSPVTSPSACWDALCPPGARFASAPRRR
jgi:hypothetical protein